jgi:hypothetical protein
MPTAPGTVAGARTRWGVGVDEDDQRIPMNTRIDRLGVELPAPPDADPAGACAVQELLGGKFGERRHADQGHRELLRAERLREWAELARDVASGVHVLDLVCRDDRVAVRHR